MQEVLIFLAAVWGLMQLTFVSYLAIMNAIRNRPLISKPAWFFIAPLAVVGVTADFLLSTVVGTILFLDLPRELLFTSRLHRYRDDPSYDNTWRQRVAKQICEKLLNAFDPTGKHC